MVGFLQSVLQELKLTTGKLRLTRAMSILNRNQGSASNCSRQSVSNRSNSRSIRLITALKNDAKSESFRQTSSRQNSCKVVKVESTRNNNWLNREVANLNRSYESISRPFDGLSKIRHDSRGYFRASAQTLGHSNAQNGSNVELKEMKGGLKKSLVEVKQHKLDGSFEHPREDLYQDPAIDRTMTFNKLKVFKGKASPNIPRLVINPSNLEHATSAPKFEEPEEENVR